MLRKLSGVENSCEAERLNIFRNSSRDDKSCHLRQVLNLEMVLDDARDIISKIYQRSQLLTTEKDLLSRRLAVARNICSHLNAVDRESGSGVKRQKDK